MRTWVWSGQIAILFGTLLFASLLVPILIWQYRRYGRLSVPRLLGSAAVALYFTALATYTWLPLPDESWCATNPGRRLQLTPFAFVDDIVRETAGLPLGARVTSFAALQVVFNVVLFVPLGALVRRYFHKNMLWVAASGLVVSLVIEATQFTGLWGIYSCSYRVADVDDVMLNTVGAVLGGLLAPALLWWMPKARSLATSRLEPRTITSWRRWLGMLLDGMAWIVLQATLAVLARVALLVVGHEPGTTLQTTIDASAAVAAWLLVFIVPSLNGGGSLGQTAVWLYPRWPDSSGRLTNGRWWQRVLRSSAISGPYLASVLLGGTTAWTTLFGATAAVLILVDVALVPFTPGKGGLSCLVTGARMTDAREDRWAAAKIA